jgi:hypothetical protein
MRTAVTGAGGAVEAKGLLVQGVARIVERPLNGAEQGGLERRGRLRPLRLSGYEGDIPRVPNFDVVHGATRTQCVFPAFRRSISAWPDGVAVQTPVAGST